jgi:mRNA-degrading endonuclease RelE of RelBE toxin-antitoxin system
MNWTSDLTNAAARDLRRSPKNVQSSVARAIALMESDPFQGNVKALQGRDWKGVFRRRISGDYRILFSVNHPTRTFIVLRILIRSESTYD